MISNLDKRLLLVAFVTISLVGFFWTGSRYPDLGEKASMGAEMELQGISFDAPFRAASTDPTWKKVAIETGNWMYTNKKGMMFGLALAACMMTFISLLPASNASSGFSNSLFGALVGCPLGVCVNCATPIAKATHDSGTRLEFTLALLLSSPSFNIVVLTMAFTLLPWYMAVTKVAIGLLFILIGVPLLCRNFSKAELSEQSLATVNRAIDQSSAGGAMAIGCEIPRSNRWMLALGWTINNLAKNLWRICVTTVPLMVLAGFLGALLATVLPWRALVDFLPGSSLPATIVTMLGFALVGTFLPVPIAFDVLIVVILLGAGMPAHHAMVFLFTLGLFSIYPFLVIRREISHQIATTLFLAVTFLGVVSGVVAHYTDAWWQARYRNTLITELQQLPAPPLDQSPPSSDMGQTESEIRAWLNPRQPDSISWPTGRNGDIRVDQYSLAKRAPSSDSLFSRQESANLGLVVPAKFDLREAMYFFQQYNRCIASGDIHHDGWPDVAIAADNGPGGIYLFANQDGKIFIRQQVQLGGLSSATICYLAMVDLNNDGWLDLFFTTYESGNHVIFNREGFFDETAIEALPSPELSHTMAAGFADLNQDGRLDIIYGNWALGWTVHQKGVPLAATNQMLMWHEGSYQSWPLKSPPGESLSVLITDLNQDTRPDVIISNEFASSDDYYLQDEANRFTSVAAENGLIEHTTRFTMSVSSADLDNDLTPEIFLAQMSRGEDTRELARQSFTNQTVSQSNDSVSSDYATNLAILTTMAGRIQRDTAGSHQLWSNLSNPEVKYDAISLAATRYVLDPEIWTAVPDHMSDLHSLRQRMKSKRYLQSTEDKESAVPQIFSHNVLLKRISTGDYQDQAKAFGLELTGWSWNAKFADLDLDQWQDLFVTNGWETSSIRETNMFFRNEKGTHFVEETKLTGLEDYFPTPASSYLDYDQDGDLDIVTVPSSVPIGVWRNDVAKQHSLTIELRDESGNHFGIGSKIIIHYGTNGELHQLREIQASGGFHSADAPVAHFGLGEFDQVGRLEIRWSTGESTTIASPLKANSRYVISRLNQE